MAGRRTAICLEDFNKILLSCKKNLFGNDDNVNPPSHQCWRDVVAAWKKVVWILNMPMSMYNKIDIIFAIYYVTSICANTSSSEDTSISGDHASNEDKVPSLQFIVTLSPENELSCINRILSIETQIRLHLRNGRWMVLILDMGEGAG